MGKQKQVKYQLDLAIAKKMIAVVASYRASKKRIAEIINEIVRLKERAEIFVQGGSRKSKEEIAEEAYVEAKRKYYNLFEEAEAVEKALEEVIQSEINIGYGRRLAETFVNYCERNRKNEWDIELAIQKTKLNIHKNTFIYKKRKFIEDLAIRLGYLGSVDLDIHGY